MNELQKITDWKYVTTDKAKHIFKQINYEFEYAQLVVRQAVVSRLTTLLLMSFAAMLCLLILSMVFNSLLLILPSFFYVISMTINLFSNTKSHYPCNAATVDQFMYEGCIDEPYRLFLISHAMTLSAGLATARQSNIRKWKFFKYSLILFLCGLFSSMITMTLTLILGGM